MAGQKDGVFREHISPFLKNKYAEALKEPAKYADILRAIEKQYRYDERESQTDKNQRRRHYEAEIQRTFEGKPLRGVEKLYRRTILIEPTTICAAHCRWCLRGQYNILHLTEDELDTIARYCGKAEENRDVREVLITGGDPLMVPDRLAVLFAALKKHAPNITVYRIGTRVPLHDPARINNRMLDILAPPDGVKIELGLHVNHSAELFPEVIEAFRKLTDRGIRFYDQSVLLKGLNDDAGILQELFDKLRYLQIEVHYLFHAIPMMGMAHHRTSIAKALKLIREITSSGYASGRSKPKLTLLTDVGKVTLFEGTILSREKERILLQTCYRYEDRKKWNPSWELPDSSFVDETGYLRVFYQDASENE
jgi:lysine 2,3-aminomutase